MQTWRKLPRNVWIVTITSFLTDISSEMVFNLLPLFLSNVLGVKTNIIGVIEGVAETTASLLKIFSGWLSDKLGTAQMAGGVGLRVVHHREAVPVRGGIVGRGAGGALRGSGGEGHSHGPA